MAIAVGPAVAGFEVKFLLTPAVLDAHHHPTTGVLKALGVKGGPKEMRMAFLDSRRRELHAERWTARVRTVGGGAVELTYKRRYPVAGTDVAAALAVAARQGFDADEPDYEAEVEWGAEGAADRLTLTMSRKKELAGEGFPAAAAVGRLAADHVPGRLARWARDGWAAAVLADAHLYGPVAGRRWAGNLGDAGIDKKLSLEVWLIRAPGGEEPVVEVSFKKDDHTEAAAAREKLRQLLGPWVSDEAALKTETILTRYG